MSNYASIDARTMTYKFMKDLGSIALGYKVYNVLYTNRRNQSVEISSLSSKIKYPLMWLIIMTTNSTDIPVITNS